MPEIAQTNLQLYEQVLELGWEQSELISLRAAYDLACDVFSARYRASGKTFVAHVVGTASVLTRADGRPTLVMAGLLHAAYQQGDFGPCRSTAARRATVRAVAGPEVEALVHAYAGSPWNVEVVHGLLGRGETLSDYERDVVLLRLANELDEHVDRGTWFGPRQGAALYRPQAVDQMATLALELGYPDLADWFEQLTDDEGKVAVPPALQSTRLGSIVRAPASFVVNPLTTAITWARRLRHDAANVPGARHLYRQARAFVVRSGSRGR